MQGIIEDELIHLAESIAIGDFEMSTNGMIARTDGTRFRGVHHHWDSYPSGLGKALYDAYHYFDRNAKKMMDYLVDDHQAGWSNIIGVDFSLRPGFIEDPSYSALSEDARRPQCYCHGERHEPARPITTFSDARMRFAEYAYVIDIHTDVMVVSERTGSEWKELAQVKLYDPEPDWNKIENA